MTREIKLQDPILLQAPMEFFIGVWDLILNNELDLGFLSYKTNENTQHNLNYLPKTIHKTRVITWKVLGFAKTFQKNLQLTIDGPSYASLATNGQSCLSVVRIRGLQNVSISSYHWVHLWPNQRGVNCLCYLEPFLHSWPRSLVFLNHS